MKSLMEITIVFFIVLIKKNTYCIISKKKIIILIWHSIQYFNNNIKIYRTAVTIITKKWSETHPILIFSVVFV